MNYSPVRAPAASLAILNEAVARWRAEGLTSAVLLGDLLDKSAQREGTVEACLAELKAALAAAPLQYHFVFGNGDADVLGRRRWVEEQFAPSSCTPERLYYSTAPTPGLRLVFLDTYEVSLNGPATADAAALATVLRMATDALRSTAVSERDALPVTTRVDVAFTSC